VSWRGQIFMGGYAFYVWSSYALTLVALSGEVWLLIRRRRRWREGIIARAPTNGRQV
jgi:heme exporter protein CcmD